MKQPQIIIVLDNIRSVHNVGSIFRTADSVGVSAIYLVGTTPTPVDRFGRKRKDLAKVALGAENSVSWKYFINAKKVINELKDDGYTIIPLEQDRKSIDYKKIKLKEKMVVVFGNEVDGVSKDILRISDQIAEIPMRGKKESLNVAVSAGIFLFRILDK